MNHPDPTERLLSAIRERGLLESPTIEGDSVTGRARLAAAVTDVTLTVDPDLEEQPELDEASLVAGVARILEITEARWSAIIDEIAAEIEDAVDGDVVETTDLRADLSISSIDVLPDATLLCFAAPKQFPDAWIRVQLDEDLEVDDLEVDAKQELD